jgi:uncharacterized protein YndB with AHSA1/START domain
VIQRELVVPVAPESLWEAITDPAELTEWFGATVEWELHPGAPARFDGHDGIRRRGLVTEVRPGRRLSFRWWNEAEGPEGASEVTYDLDPAPGGDATRLVVTERPVDPVPPMSDPAASSGERLDAARDAWNAWTDWDGRLLGAWAAATRRVMAGARH